MIDGSRRGYEFGCQLSKLFGVPGIEPELVRGYAIHTLAFLISAGFAHLEPADAFIKNFIEGWYSRMYAEAGEANYEFHKS